MGCHYEWADETRLILHLYLVFPWTWEEFDEAAQTVYEPLHKENRPFATVIDVTNMGRIPAGNVIAHLQQIDRLLPEKLFLSVIVGAPYAAAIFMNIFMAIRPSAKRNTAFANTVQEAHQLINKRYELLYPEGETSTPTKEQ